MNLFDMLNFNFVNNDTNKKTRMIRNVRNIEDELDLLQYASRDEMDIFIYERKQLQQQQYSLSSSRVMNGQQQQLLTSDILFVCIQFVNAYDLMKNVSLVSKQFRLACDRLLSSPDSEYWRIQCETLGIYYAGGIDWFSCFKREYIARKLNETKLFSCRRCGRWLSLKNVRDVCIYHSGYLVEYEEKRDGFIDEYGQYHEGYSISSYICKYTCCHKTQREDPIGCLSKPTHDFTNAFRIVEQLKMNMDQRRKYTSPSTIPAFRVANRFWNFHYKRIAMLTSLPPPAMILYNYINQQASAD
jgi:hypothetical protein